jgi:ribulose-5-phosphate 4-epimerase/fuculose-1-phosphate aldolase
MDSDPRPLMVEIAHLLYERRLTNSAGGNMSCRVGDRIYITPRYLGSKHRWRLREAMVLVCDADGC